ncbi:MAG: ABC transporter permease, partial [Luteibacter sp.]
MSAVALPTRRRAGTARFAMSRELMLVAVTVGLTLLVGALNRDFLGAQNLRFMLLNSVVLSLVALGQTLVIAMRGIDLSVAPILGLAAMVCGLLAQTHGISLAVALPLALGIGLVLGTINGVLVATMDIPPIVVTLGTYSLYSGLTFLYSDGTQVDSVPPMFASFGNGHLFGVLPVPTPVAVLVVVLASCWYMLRHTGFG